MKKSEVYKNIRKIKYSFFDALEENKTPLVCQKLSMEL